MITPKLCEQCNKLTKPLLSRTRPQSSEWYCEPCHASYPMTPEEYRVISQMMSQQERQAV